MWSKGSIKVNNDIIDFWVKHYEEGSAFGIEEGRISKLALKCNGKVIANYDREWDIKPKNENAKKALAILMKTYN